MQIVMDSHTTEVLFGYRFCMTTGSGVFRDYQNFINDVMSYLALNRNAVSNELSHEKFDVRLCSLDQDYPLESILGDIDANTHGLSIYYGSNYCKNKLKPLEGDFHGWQELNTASCPLSQYLTSSSSGSAKAYMKTTDDGSRHRSFVYIENFSSVTTMLEKIISAIPKLMPDLYTDNNYSTDEIAVFEYISKGNIEGVTSFIKDKLLELNVDEIVLRKEFDGYENIVIKKQKEGLGRLIESLQCDYNCLAEKLADKMQSIIEKTAAYDAMCNVGNDGRSFVDFILSHKNIAHVKSHDGCFTYAVDETIDYFDQDAFERYYSNPNCSFLVNREPETKKILEGLFIKRFGKLRVYGEFKCSNLSSIKALRAGDYVYIDYKNHFKHPHLGNYACLGNNVQPIATYFSNGDWDLAIEQTIAATKNLNFGDSIVMERFTWQLNDAFISNDSNKYIIANNGQEMTVGEFYKYVEQLEKEQTQSEEKQKDEQTNQINQ